MHHHIDMIMIQQLMVIILKINVRVVICHQKIVVVCARSLFVCLALLETDNNTVETVDCLILDSCCLVWFILDFKNIIQKKKCCQNKILSKTKSAQLKTYCHKILSKLNTSKMLKTHVSQTLKQEFYEHSLTSTMSGDNILKL